MRSRRKGSAPRWALGLRWGLGVALNATVPNLPLGTLAANLIGGYLIGVGGGPGSSAAGHPPELRLFVTTGFLGGLTTFSAFSGEVDRAAVRSAATPGRRSTSCSHLGGSILATIAGIETVRRLG